MKLTYLLVALALCQLVCGQLVMQGTVRDFSPHTMAHGRFPEDWWKYAGWTNTPKEGDCGEANGGKGFENSDFELPLYLYSTTPKVPNGPGKMTNGEYGLVGKLCNKTNGFKNCGVTDEDRKPIYAYTGGSPLGTVRNPASFAKWFRDTPESRMILYNITLQPSGPRTFTYTNLNFFPFDGKGWKDNNCADSACSKRHNYGYCMEIHGHFAYQGGETFHFLGDDDVWVYLDGRLVIDLGGVHTELEALVKLDDMGLTKGTNYKIDFFYCERHTVLSKFSLTTSIAIACTYYDWCDVCEGDGQSCCTPEKLALCDDKDMCTIDTCAVLVPPKIECVHVRVDCNDDNFCTNDVCDKTKGCVYTSKTCNDNSLCTIDTCVNSTGCKFTPITCNGDKCNIPSCDPATGCLTTPVTCDDGNKCTTDSCDPKLGCQFVPIVCDDKSECTTDTCDKDKGCVYTPKTCDDGSKCTEDSCSPLSGCIFKSITCDDSDACTDDTCVKDLGCQFKKKTCDDGDACTADSCDKLTGCKFEKKDCNDKNACTTDTCDPVKGCQYKNITCNDNTVCTTDTCVPASGCSFVKVVCDDKDACTTDSCDPVNGCQFKKIVCDDGDECTVDSCDPKSGCTYVPRVCNDNNACTTDTCDPKSGCKYANINCDDKNACTKDNCDPKSGCSNVPIVCDDKNACTNDTCLPASGCSFTQKSCDDKDACTEDSCDVNKGCQNEVKKCDDGKVCTADTCDKVTGCKYTEVPCNLCTANGVVECPPLNGDLCFPRECDPATGNCIDRFITCNDKSNCTIDECKDGKCVFTKKNCDDGDACTIDTCDIITGCKSEKISCDDKNPCTSDACVGGECKFTQVAAEGLGLACGPTCCSWSDPCKPQICKDNKCVDAPVDCNDNNKCTIDKCYASGTKGLCNNTAIVCDNSDLCNPQTCNLDTGACDKKPVTCNDENMCTNDKCVAEGGKAVCKFTDIPCDNSDLCNPQTCNSADGSCTKNPVLCDDSNKCTTDKCVVSGGVANCSFTAVKCETTDLCNPQSCNPDDGQCVGLPILCDDNNPCTNDGCAVKSGVAACQFVPVECDNSDLCKPQTCNITLGACFGETVNCDDGNMCTADKCVFNDGDTKAVCQNELISCADFNTGDLCVPAVCNATVGCVAGPASICDDLNPCTIDKCVGPMNCSHELGACDDNDECTVDICDSNQRTLDEACSYSPLNCTEVPSPCQVFSECHPVNGCMFTPVVCPEPKDWCMTTLCDEKVGCLEVPRTCVVDDADCYVGICDSEQKKCRTEERDEFTKITTSKHGGVTCFLFYKKAEATAIITAGAIAGIVIGAVIFAALAALGARQAYLWAQLRQGAMGGAQGNPLYQPSQTHGENPLFGS